MTDRAHNTKPHEVSAMLAGRMSQMRRILKPQPEAGWQLDPRRAMAAAEGHFWFTDDPEFPGNHLIRARYAPGDRLWVRETWRTAKSMDAWKPKKIEEACLESGYRRPWAPIQYEADGTRENFDDEPSEPGKTRVAIHLPRWASRLTLIVTDVRVQRLQDIGYKDAIAEGIVRGDPLPEVPNSHGYIWHDGVTDPIDGWTRDPTVAFASLWKSIHGPDAWAANPWVVAVSFKTIRANIDSAEAKAA